MGKTGRVALENQNLFTFTTLCVCACQCCKRVCECEGLFVYLKTEWSIYALEAGEKTLHGFPGAEQTFRSPLPSTYRNDSVSVRSRTVWMSDSRIESNRNPKSRDVNRVKSNCSQDMGAKASERVRNLKDSVWYQSSARSHFRQPSTPHRPTAVCFPVHFFPCVCIY